MFYLVACSRCIQRLDELERVKARFFAHESKYKLQITEFEREVHGFNQKCDILALEKAIVEEVWVSLEAKWILWCKLTKG